MSDRSGDESVASVVKREIKPTVREQLKASTKGLFYFAAFAAAVAVIYVFAVDHVWEDYFITFRHSQNLADGNGLVYDPPERLHGFTSPLGTLLPAGCYVVTGKTGWEPGLWLFRALSILALAAGCYLTAKSFQIASPYYTGSTLAITLLYAFEPKFVEFSTDGQETGFLLLFLAWGLYLLIAGFPERWLAGGICWAGLLWTRPDGFIYIAELGLAGLLFAEGPRMKFLAAAFKSAVVCTILYLPWFAGAWIYYGSPIPQTVIAKSDLYSPIWSQLNAWIGNNFQSFHERATDAFLPIYWGFNEKTWWPGHEWSQWFLMTSARYLSLLCTIYWLLPVNDTLGRMASLCFAITSLYFSAMFMHFPWYLPPATWFGLVVLIRAVFTFGVLAARCFPKDRLLGSATSVAIIIISVLGIRQLLMLVLGGAQMAVHQELIEYGNRMQIGLWLKVRVQPNDRVMLEPLGYIGYFSGATMTDWPGLVSREVTKLRKEKFLGPAGLAREMLPEWMVMRPGEVSEYSPQPFFKYYALGRVFDVSERVKEYPHLPGRDWLMLDSIFYVFHKLAGPDEPSPFRETPVPLKPVDVHHMHWNGNSGRGAGEDSYLEFCLPQPQFVSAIRLTYSYTDTESPATLELSWGSSDEPKVQLGKSVAWPQNTSPGELSLLIEVGEVIDRFRFSPNNKSFQFKLQGIQLLTPSTTPE